MSPIFCLFRCFLLFSWNSLCFFNSILFHSRSSGNNGGNRRLFLMTLFSCWNRCWRLGFWGLGSGLFFFLGPDRLLGSTLGFCTGRGLLGRRWCLGLGSSRSLRLCRWAIRSLFLAGCFCNFDCWLWSLGLCSFCNRDASGCFRWLV